MQQVDTYKLWKVNIKIQQSIYCDNIISCSYLMQTYFNHKTHHFSRHPLRFGSLHNYISFSSRVFFHRHWRFIGQQGRGGDHLLFHSTTSTSKGIEALAMSVFGGKIKKSGILMHLLLVLAVLVSFRLSHSLFQKYFVLQFIQWPYVNSVI